MPREALGLRGIHEPPLLLWLVARRWRRLLGLPRLAPQPKLGDQGLEIGVEALELLGKPVASLANEAWAGVYAGDTLGR